MSDEEKQLKKAETLAVLTDAIQVAYVNQFMSKEYASAVFKHNMRELGFDAPKKTAETPVTVK